MPVYGHSRCDCFSNLGSAGCFGCLFVFDLPKRCVKQLGVFPRLERSFKTNRVVINKEHGLSAVIRYHIRGREAECIEVAILAKGVR
jgi:hypothetical protein